MLKQLGYLLTAAAIAFLGAATVSFAQNTAPVQDYSKGYGMQGLPRFVEPPQARQRTIVDLSPEVNVSGVLGCAGLEIDAMMRDVLGVGNIDASAIADQMMQNLQSQFAQQMLTQLMADPTISSIQQQISALANARLTMMKAECNAIQAKEDGALAMIRAEAQRRCFEEHGLNDTRCEDGTFLRNAVEEVVAEPRWSKSFQEQICDREKENCEWLRVLPDYKPNLSPDSKSDDTGSDAAASSGSSSSGSDDADGSSSSSGGDGADTSSSSGSSSGSSSSSGGEANQGSKEVQPPAISLFEIRDGVREDMLDEIALRTASAISAVQKYGYTGALKYATTGREPTETSSDDAPPPSTTSSGGSSSGSSGGNNDNGGNTESADDRGTATPFTLADVAQSASCANYTLEAPDAFAKNPNETPNTAAPLQAVGAPEPITPTPAPPSDSGWVWPTDHRKITSRYGPRNISNGGSPNHSGTDIRAYEGNPVYAMIGGKITKADNTPTSGTGSSCGNTIMLVSGPWRLGHCHLSAFRVRAGDIVQAGQVIGLSGATSNGRIRNMAAHLHLTVRHNGVRKDPEDTVLAMATGTAPEMPENGDGPDEYGNESYAHAAASSSPPDSAFVKALHEDLRKLTLRVGQTADCMLNREVDPHVYVRMAMLPKIMQESMIDTLAEGMAHRAIITTFNSIIQQLALSLAQKTGGGENAMNEATIKFAKQQIDLLKNMRDALQSDYDMKEEMSARIQEMNDYVENAQKRARQRTRR